MNRRRFLMSSAALGAGLAAFPVGWAGAEGAATRKILLFTKSSGFEHSTVKRKDGQLAFAEELLTDLGKQHGFEVTATKDGGVFTPAEIAKYDAFFFLTTGDLTKPGNDKNPPMTEEGKAAFLAAIKGGKGFLGCHNATDTFLYAGGSEEERYKSHAGHLDPYTEMIGAEFIHHDAQQKSKMHVVDPKFPGFDGVQDFEMTEEWYSLKDFAPNMHVLLVQETEGMHGPHYARPAYPATWARAHGKGRVFYTSMGHREDVWHNPTFQQILLGGIAWAVGNVKADVTPNLETAAPQHSVIPARPAPKPKA